LPNSFLTLSRLIRHQALSCQFNLNKPSVYTVIDLVGANTINEKALEVLENKEDLTMRIKDATSFFRAFLRGIETILYCI